MYQKNNNDTKFSLAFLGFTLIALLVFLSMRMVPVGHIGIVTSFGRITGTSLEPGMHFTLPWHSVKRIDNLLHHVSLHVFFPTFCAARERNSV